MREEVLQFGSKAALVGIVTTPDEDMVAQSLPGIILLNSGLVHRVGVNRLHVRVARKLARLGFPVLRFDLSGLGDSSVRRDHLPFEKSAVLETREAMDAMHREMGLDRFVLMGLCSGAIVSFQTALLDQRVVGTALLNAGGHLHGNDEALAEKLYRRVLIRHYLRMVVFSSFRLKNISKILKGQGDYRRILSALANIRPGHLLKRKGKGSARMHGLAELQRLTRRGTRLFLLHSEADEGLDYLHAALGNDVRRLNEIENLRFEVMKGANHTFIMRWSQEQLFHLLQDWLSHFMEDCPDNSSMAHANHDVSSASTESLG